MFHRATTAPRITGLPAARPSLPGHPVPKARSACARQRPRAATASRAPAGRVDRFGQPAPRLQLRAAPRRAARVSSKLVLRSPALPPPGVGGHCPICRRSPFVWNPCSPCSGTASFPMLPLAPVASRSSPAHCRLPLAGFSQWSSHAVSNSATALPLRGSRVPASPTRVTPSVPPPSRPATCDLAQTRSRAPAPSQPPSAHRPPPSSRLHIGSFVRPRDS